jgi:nucleotide-binding universal stress UspA family protein
MGLKMRLPRFWKDRRLIAISVVAIVIIAALSLGAWSAVGRDRVEEITFGEVMATATSVRTGTYDHVVVASSAPILASAATPLAVWYDKPAGEFGMMPLLVEGEDEEAGQQARLKDHLSLSSPLRVDGPDHTTASIQAALTAFERAGGAVVVDVGFPGYTASMQASLIASYLDIPVLVREGSGSDRAIRQALRELKADFVVLAGPFSPSRTEVAGELGLPVLMLNEEELEQAMNMLIADRFGRVDYGVLANPTDVSGISCVDVQTDGPVEWEETGRFEAVERAGHLETLGTGTSSTTLSVEMAEGIQRLEVRATITSMDDPLRGIKENIGIVPIVSLWLEDGSGQLVAYGSSIGYRAGEAALDVVAIDETDDLSLRVSIFYGISGRTNLGTMGNGLDSVGWSRVAANWEVSFTRTPLNTPMVPQVPGLSRLAPYLAALHGGFVVTDPDLSYLNEEWAQTYSTSTGPWYEKDQHEGVNAHVDRNVEALDGSIRALNLQEVTGGGTLYETYTSGPAWLALLGDATAIPQYYVEKDPSWEEDTQFGLGWATDEMYRLNGTLSIGRVLSTTTAGASTLIARTMWYEEYTMGHMETLSYAESNDWMTNYMLLFGEGGGQTGGLFWQRPFADELRSIGWNVEQYGDTMENDRQTMELRGAYERSNFMEVMLHGNWYWYVPEMNGPDEYSTSVKNLDIRTWELGPSFFISAACLMGRIDGVPADQSIALNFMQSGVNAFVGATRSTGSESGTRWMEWSLLYNDTSVGEALRHSFAVNPAIPTVYVRTLFADPAFNPYEPGNGFSDQGRPEIEW